MEYQQIKVFLAWPCWLCPGVSTALLRPRGGVVVLGTCRGVVVGVVFGALLGPEATGPFCSNAGGHFWCFFCSCFCPFTAVVGPALCVWVVVVGVVDGVVV